MHRSKVKKGFVAFKIDFKKVSDKVIWDFLEGVLKDFGFP